MMGQYVRRSARLSWHVVRTPTRMFDTYRTLCSRTVVTRDVRAEEPLNEKGCETCARAALRIKP